MSNEGYSIQPEELTQPLNTEASEWKRVRDFRDLPRVLPVEKILHVELAPDDRIKDQPAVEEAPPPTPIDEAQTKAELEAYRQKTQELLSRHTALIAQFAGAKLEFVSND